PARSSDLRTPSGPADRTDATVTGCGSAGSTAGSVDRGGMFRKSLAKGSGARWIERVDRDVCGASRTVTRGAAAAIAPPARSTAANLLREDGRGGSDGSR